VVLERAGDELPVQTWSAVSSRASSALAARRPAVTARPVGVGQQVARDPEQHGLMGRSSALSCGR
jgi:hypothetical protein